MALLFMDGFDLQDYLVKGWYSYDLNGGADASATGRNSGRGVQTSFGGGYYAGEHRIQRSTTATGQITLGFAIYVSSYGSGGLSVSLYTDNGATRQLTITSAISTQYIALQRGGYTGTSLVTSSKFLPTGTWNYLEIQATISDTTGSCEVRLNGGTTPIISFTGDTKVGGTSNLIDMISIGSHRLADNSGNGATVIYDDLYILDNTGASNTTFLGDVRIATLQPNAPGTDTQLTPTGSVTNWQNVDETPYSSTDYNASATVSLRDTYSLSDLPVNTTTIHAIQSNIIAAKSDATSASARIPLRTGGSLYYGTTNSLSTSYFNYRDIHQVNPNTTANWTPADVNSLEVGMEVA